MSRTIVLLFIFASVVAAQGEAVPSAPTQAESEADRILRQVDKKIYYAANEGLKGFRFRMAMSHGSGNIPAALKGVYVRVSWQKPSSWRFDLVDPKGKLLKDVPEVLRHESGRKLLETWKADIQGMASYLLAGVPLQRKYARHSKSVKSRTVNNKVEHRIIMHPDRKRTYTEAVLKIVNSLPRELVYLNERGERFVTRFIFSERKELNKWLWIGVEQEGKSRKIREEEYEYLTRGGYLLLSRLKRLDYLGQTIKSDFKVEGLEVDPVFAEGYFPAPATTK